MRDRFLPTLLVLVLLVGGLLLPGHAAAQSPDPIELTKTVGTDPMLCASTDQIEVPEDTVVTWCFRFTNNSPMTYTLHTLVDEELGMILDNKFLRLDPGASGFVTETMIAVTDVTAMATWTATAPVQIVSVATDTATLMIAPPTAITLASLQADRPASAARLLALLLLGLLVGAALVAGNRKSTVG